MRPRCRALKDLGHEIDVINDSYQDFGAGQFIWRAGNPAGRLCGRQRPGAATGWLQGTEARGPLAEPGPLSSLRTMRALA